MSYQLKANESISVGITRIATEEIEKAIKELSPTSKLEVDEAVHQVRKRLKKTRAVIRLVRDRLGKKTYQQENARFRDIGNNLALLRDSKVQIATLDSLVAHFADIDSEIFTDIYRELQVDYRREYQRVSDEGILKLVRNQLKDSQNAIASWQIDSDDWSAIDKSVKRVYQRGYQGLHSAISEPSLENLHDWRKRVKDLRYQLMVLCPIWSEMIEQWIDQTHNLSDYLGEDHDLAILKQFISSQPERFNDRNSLETLINLCDRRRQELQSAAILLGKRIYTEKANDFVKRIGNYWQIWHKETILKP